MRVWVIVGLLFCTGILAKEFLYPVGYCPQHDEFFVIYQKASSHIELWNWNPHTQFAHQVLLSRYSPAGFALLPYGSGFSFVDNGQLKVKQFIKRSPRTIEYDAPLYNVERVHWIDDTTCYASGNYHDYAGIFQIDWDGCVSPLHVIKGVDFHYPQKVNDHLFSIERSQEGYRIVRTLYPSECPQEEFADRLRYYADHMPEFEQVISFGTTPIAFLLMQSEQEGYVLSHPDIASKNDPTVRFGFHHLWKEEDEWHSMLLFSFDIPTHLLIGRDRLYESILPLLPYACQNKIYFVDSSESNHLSLYAFDLDSYSKHTVATGNNKHIFGVSQYFDTLMYGGEMSECIDMSEGVRMRFGVESIC